METLRTIFKVKGDTKVSLLSQERISRAKTMMTPFVLRRRKDQVRIIFTLFAFWRFMAHSQVLKDLPNKTERIEWCHMTELQSTIYHNTLQRSRKTIIESSVEGSTTGKSTKKTRTTGRTKDTLYAENSSNVLMDLRKAASHPMLFRTRFTDETLTGITKQLLKEPDFKKRGAVFDLVKEDMSVMTDSELQVFCATYKVCSTLVALQRVPQDKLNFFSPLGNISKIKNVTWTQERCKFSWTCYKATKMKVGRF